MIDKCNADIATWAEAGDSFVVKNVDKFSSEVLPLCEYCSKRWMKMRGRFYLLDDWHCSNIRSFPLTPYHRL